jgi:hypothetical protein
MTMSDLGAFPPQGWSLQRVGGAAIALGALGVVAVSALYALSPPAAALPAQPFRLAEALRGALEGAATMHAAGAIGIFADLVFAVGGALVAAAASQRGDALAGAGWIAAALASLLFTFVDATAGFVLSPLAAAPDGGGAFLGFKRLFDVLFLLSTIALGAGAALALAREIGTASLALGKALPALGVAASLVGLVASIACGLGVPAEQGVGASVAASAVVFTLIGWRLAAAPAR